MKIIILPYSATPNPLGFPGEYPAERKEIDDKDTISDGWIEVTEEEWKRRFETHYAAVESIIEADATTKKAAEQSKQAEVDGYYVSLKTLREKITSAGKLEPAEQLELFGYLIDILIAKENSNGKI